MFALMRSLPYVHRPIGPFFLESANRVFLASWYNITLFGDSGLVQPTGTKVWQRALLVHTVRKREGENRDRFHGASGIAKNDAYYFKQI